VGKYIGALTREDIVPSPWFWQEFYLPCFLLYRGNLRGKRGHSNYIERHKSKPVNPFITICE
jgi:hypothetical protein